MPPRKQKVDHRRGGGGKHISTFEEVKARNAGEETAYDKARRARTSKPAEKEEEGSDEEEEEVVQDKEKKAPAKKQVGLGGIEVENPNSVQRNVDKEGVELTRKQREELDKQAARRRYEELHKAGKTDEAKADLKRLEEVKKRREEAAKKRAEEEAAAKEKESEKNKNPKSVLIDELKEAMGGDGKRGKKKEEVAAEEKAEKAEKPAEEAPAPRKKGTINSVDEAEVYAPYASAGKSVEAAAPAAQAGDGSIEACREAEADFM